MSNILLLVSQKYEIVSQTRAAWSQAYANWWQLWVEVLSVIVAIILLILHYTSREIHWLPKYKQLIINKKRYIKLFLLNTSDRNATNTIITKAPIFVICDINTFFKILGFTPNRKKYQEKFTQGRYYKKSDYDKYLINTYYRLLDPNILGLFLDNNKNNPEYKITHEMTNKIFEIYGNKTAFNSLNVSIHDLFITFQNERKLYRKLLKEDRPNDIHMYDWDEAQEFNKYLNSLPKDYDRVPCAMLMCRFYDTRRNKSKFIILSDSDIFNM